MKRLRTVFATGLVVLIGVLTLTISVGCGPAKPKVICAMKNPETGQRVEHSAIGRLAAVVPAGHASSFCFRLSRTNKNSELHRDKHSLGEFYNTRILPLKGEVPSEKAELNELFKASDAVRAAQRSLAACADKVLTALAVPGLVKAWRHEAPEAIAARVGRHDASHS